jgi:hypothetical protein
MTERTYSRRQVTKLGLAAAAGLSAPFIGGRPASARDAKLIFWLQPNFNKMADDLLVEVVAEGDEHLLEIISGRIRAIDGVVATETFMYLSLLKQTYSWGVR